MSNFAKTYIAARCNIKKPTKTKHNLCQQNKQTITHFQEVVKFANFNEP